METINRSLSVFADGYPLTSFRHARLTGRDALGLYPMPFTLRLWNPSESDYLALSAAKKVTVSHEHSVLASGTVSDVYRRPVAEGTLVEVVFAAGLALWETPVSLAVAPGASVSETVRSILESMDADISLLSFPGDDPVRSRGQSFYGRAAECVEIALSFAGARGYLTDAGLCIVPKEGLPVSMEIASADLPDHPVFVGDHLLLIRTRTVGWPLGKTVAVRRNGATVTGLVRERSIDADNTEGNWQAEVLLEVML